MRASIRHASLALVAALLLATVFIPATAEGDELPNFKKMRVKELNKLLKERGVDAKGIAEKGELVQLVQDNYHLPIVEVEETPPPRNPDLEPKKVNEDDLDEMLRKMQAETGQSFKVFKPGDNLNDFVKNMGGPNSEADKKRARQQADKLKDILKEEKEL